MKGGREREREGRREGEKERGRECRSYIQTQL